MGNYYVPREMNNYVKQEYAKDMLGLVTAWTEMHPSSDIFISLLKGSLSKFRDKVSFNKHWNFHRRILQFYVKKYIKNDTLIYKTISEINEDRKTYDWMRAIDTEPYFMTRNYSNSRLFHNIKELVNECEELMTDEIEIFIDAINNQSEINFSLHENYYESDLKIPEYDEMTEKSNKHCPLCEQLLINFILGNYIIKDQLVMLRALTINQKENFRKERIYRTLLAYLLSQDAIPPHYKYSKFIVYRWKKDKFRKFVPTNYNIPDIIKLDKNSELINDLKTIIYELNPTYKYQNHIKNYLEFIEASNDIIEIRNCDGIYELFINDKQIENPGILTDIDEKKYLKELQEYRESHPSEEVELVSNETESIEETVSDKTESETPSEEIDDISFNNEPEKACIAIAIKYILLPFTRGVESLLSIKSKMNISTTDKFVSGFINMSDDTVKRICDEEFRYNYIYIDTLLNSNNYNTYSSCGYYNDILNNKHIFVSAIRCLLFMLMCERMSKNNSIICDDYPVYMLSKHSKQLINPLLYELCIKEIINTMSEYYQGILFDLA